MLEKHSTRFINWIGVYTKTNPDDSQEIIKLFLQIYKTAPKVPRGAVQWLLHLTHWTISQAKMNNL